MWPTPTDAAKVRWKQWEESCSNGRRGKGACRRRKVVGGKRGSAASPCQREEAIH